jgi:hypothetical protein
MPRVDNLTEYNSPEFNEILAERFWFPLYCNGFDQRIAGQRLNTRTQHQNNRVMQSVSRQRLDKHISAY